MKSEFEKMRSEELYNFRDPKLKQSLHHAKQICERLQTLTIDHDAYRETIESLIPNFPKSSTVCPPFHCDHGHGIVVGENVFINYNCTFLDGGMIRIGRNTLIGPNCQLYTPQHPMDYIARRKPEEYAHPISIGEDCWLGGGVIVCPGVTIGNRCIIAAGSVVIRDIPDDSLAAGNPAAVKRSLKADNQQIR